jgi:hypothetical protein
VDRQEFISEEITVVRDKNLGNPVSFRWRDRDYIIKDVVAAWADWGFPAGAPRKKDWRLRRHRNYYRVETADGAVFELYHDRGVKLAPGTWVLYRRLA